jgi:hypothetical protein
MTMKTLLAFLLLAAPVLAQDRPPDNGGGNVPPDRPRDGDRPRSERPRDGDNPRPPAAPRDGDRPRPPAPPLPPTPPGAPRDGREGNRRPAPPFNPEEVGQWLRDNEPESFRHLNQLQEDGRRDEAQRFLAEASVRMRDLSDLKQRDPKAFERMQEMRRLEREGGELAEQGRKASPEEKDAVSRKLQENLSKQFDLREDQRVREIGELKRRVEALEKSLGERKANKDKIVERRRRELMGEKGDDEW